MVAARDPKTEARDSMENHVSWSYPSSLISLNIDFSIPRGDQVRRV